MKKSRYPTYDVMSHKDEWDGHTQSIVASRLEGVAQFSALSLEEAEMLRAICSILAGDDRADLIQFVVSHIDRSLSQPAGESERKADVPKAGELLHTGLQLLDKWCLAAHQRTFISLPEEQQMSIVSDLSSGRLPFPAEWAFPQKAFFNKLFTWTVESYYSHPTVWSEIGYGGPAYPRGYVRANIGQLDPWEAKAEQ
jgi:hypothetical protein